MIVLMFFGMLTAVEIFGKESEGKKAGKSIKVTEVDFKIRLPQKTFAPGTYTFDLTNNGARLTDLVAEYGVNRKTTRSSPRARADAQSGQPRAPGENAGDSGSNLVGLD